MFALERVLLVLVLMMMVDSLSSRGGLSDVSMNVRTRGLLPQGMGSVALTGDGYRAPSCPFWQAFPWPSGYRSHWSMVSMTRVHQRPSQMECIQLIAAAEAKVFTDDHPHEPQAFGMRRHGVCRNNPATLAKLVSNCILLGVSAETRSSGVYTPHHTDACLPGSSGTRPREDHVRLSWTG